MAGSKRRRQVGEMDKFLVGHLLKKKLTGEMEAHGAIPELDIYKWEAEQLFILYDVLSEKSSGGRECFFFCPHGDGRRPRLTERGYWKGRNYELDIAKKGTKRYFTYYQGRQGQHRRTDVTMHEYHMIPAVSDPEISDPKAFVICRIMKGESKKAKPATATASTELSGPSNLNTPQLHPQESSLNPTTPPDFGFWRTLLHTGSLEAASSGQPDDNRYAAAPSNCSPSMPYSPSHDINLMDIFTSNDDDNNNLQGIFN